jgi:FAD binding domain/Berberine and berberine like
MLPPSRRQFIRRAAGSLAALCAYPFAARSDSTGVSDPRSQRIHSFDVAAIQALAAKMDGHLVTPDADDYETARLIFNRAFDRHPALIIYCASASDVARGLEFAQRNNVPIAVRSGGHNRAGLSSCDNGVVIDLSRMNQVTVDVAGRVARAAGGARVINLDAATQAVGLATTAAECPTVGLAGLTLGGGEGVLMSKYGATCDNLISAQLVTVDGQQIKVSQHSNPELFWAIRGGGGNFGVVTALEYRLHPLNEVLAGTLLYSNGRIPELLQAFAKFVAAAPDEMNVLGLISASAAGARLQVMVCHCGDTRVGNGLLASLRSLKPQQDSVRTMSYLELNATNPAAPAADFQTNVFLPDLSAAAIEAIATAFTGAPPNTRVFIVPFYGAITRVGLNDTAFPLRSFGFELDITGRWADPADRPRAIEWVKGLRDSLRPFARGAYVNQLGETSEELVRGAYGPHYTRLAAIKKKYDPKNVLRLNQNIKPA